MQVKEMNPSLLPFHGFKEAIRKTVAPVISPQNRLGRRHNITIKRKEEISAHAVKVMKIKKPIH